MTPSRADDPSGMFRIPQALFITVMAAMKRADVRPPLRHETLIG